MYLVGLTGGIATGKSTVSKMLLQRGCKLIDADVIAREALDVGTKGYTKVKHHFGTEIIAADGTIDRQKLGAIIFADGDKRRLLNSIVHPYVRKAMLWQVIEALCTGYRYVVLDIPLLIESHAFLSILSEVIVVYCKPETQLRRLMIRNGYSKDEAQSRINSQLAIEDKKQFATHPLCLIDNNEGRDSTEAQVLALKQYLDGSWRSFRNKLALIALVLSLPLAIWATWGRTT